MRLIFLAVLALLFASACVTITPVAQVAALPTPPPTVPVAPATQEPAPAPDATAGSTDTGPTDKPTRTPKPSKSTDPTSEPTADSSVNPDDPACFDDAYTLEGFAWDAPFEWSYNAAQTPAGYNLDAVLAVIQRGFDNVTTENNDCGRPDHVFEDATYVGSTSKVPCGVIGDGVNVVGWGVIPSDLSDDTIAYTCPYHFSQTGIIAEADIVISVDVEWALSADECLFQEMLEPTITHEVGHALGLGHVNERQHPYLTMSTRSNGPCTNDESSLGLGDMLGLESLYPGQ